MNEPTVFTAHSSYVLDVAFSLDGQTLISCGMDSAIKVWSVPAWGLTQTLRGHEKSVNNLVLSPDGRTVATSSTDATVRLWSFPEGELRCTLRDRKKTAAVVSFAADGGQVAAGWYGGRATVWTVAGKEVAGIKVSSKNLVAVAFCGTGDTLAAAGLGDDISLWSLPSGEAIGALSGHQTAVLALLPFQEGTRLVSLGYEQTIRFWDVAARQEVRRYALEGPPARGLALSTDEARIAIGMEGRIQIRSMADWSLQRELPFSTKAVYGMAFSPDGCLLAAGAADGKIRVWEIKND